jgi:hypothetical protein
MIKTQVERGFQFQLSAGETEVALLNYLREHHKEEIPEGCEVVLTSYSGFDHEKIARVAVTARGDASRT